MPRQIFKNRVLATAGPLPGQLTVDNLKRWTSIRKGQFSEDFDETVTHLLCTREQFNQKVPRVKEALKRGKRLHIVHFDWFEFSTVKEKRQPERDYSMRIFLAKQNAARRELARIEKGKRDGEKFVNTNLFHIYIDREFFPYQIDLNRDDEATGEVGQRYTLCLWESNATPSLYWFTAKFLKKKGSSQPSHYRPSPCSGKWETEMNHFMEFFRIKTGIDWEDRVIKEKTMAPSFFQYTPPGGGKPVGRRLRFDYDYCRQINTELRGLPWPPPEPVLPIEEQMGDDGPIQAEDGDALDPDSGSKEANEDTPALDGGGYNEGTSTELEGDEPTHTEEECHSSPESSQSSLESALSEDTTGLESACSSPSSDSGHKEATNPEDISGEKDQPPLSKSTDILTPDGTEFKEEKGFEEAGMLDQGVSGFLTSGQDGQGTLEQHEQQSLIEAC